jgi:hypothetical protein
MPSWITRFLTSSWSDCANPSVRMCRTYIWLFLCTWFQMSKCPNHRFIKQLVALYLVKENVVWWVILAYWIWALVNRTIFSICKYNCSQFCHTFVEVLVIILSKWSSHFIYMVHEVVHYTCLWTEICHIFMNRFVTCLSYTLFLAAQFYKKQKKSLMSTCLHSGIDESPH